MSKRWSAVARRTCSQPVAAAVLATSTSRSWGWALLPLRATQKPVWGIETQGWPRRTEAACALVWTTHCSLVPWGHARPHGDLGSTSVSHDPVTSQIHLWHSSGPLFLSVWASRARGLTRPLRGWTGAAKAFSSSCAAA